MSEDELNTEMRTKNEVGEEERWLGVRRLILADLRQAAKLSCDQLSLPDRQNHSKSHFGARLAVKQHHDRRLSVDFSFKLKRRLFRYNDRTVCLFKIMAH
ncbi:hypothetical protein AVEN_48415-1 [Araneus ventricosus]|uniref:Uncharacterized protein n=1 Tax=Araneus ventricosus TaxID=182803 RepID=A0A4Y2TGI8_ARAVE|nr:hypothetical protein AVEN_48415-1 [Araneus ventricosus]